MSFRILQYRASVEKRLSQMSHRHRNFFSMWCLHAMLSKYNKDLDLALKATDKEFIYRSFDLLCDLFERAVAPKEILAEINARCLKIEPLDPDYLRHVLFVQVVPGLAGVVEVFETGDSGTAAILAEYVLNCIDAEFEDKGGESPIVMEDSDLIAFPEYKLELRSQSCILSYLETSPTVSMHDLERCR